jgi:anti-sigma factor RsiW
MDCRECQKLLQAYLDGDLDGAPFAEVEHHLERCPDCRSELDRLVKMRDLLRELKEVEVPAGEREAFIEALMARIEAERARGYRRPTNWRPALVASIAVVLILIVIVSIGPGARPPTIAPGPKLNALENAAVDILVMGALDDQFLATQGDFLSDPALVRHELEIGWKTVINTHRDLLERTE